MTEAEAVRSLRGLLAAHGQSLEAARVEGVVLSCGDVDILFDYVGRALRCRAELHRFRRDPDPRVFERIKTTPPKIGALVIEERSLYLEHRYQRSPPLTRLVTEIGALIDESRAWICVHLAQS